MAIERSISVRRFDDGVDRWAMAEASPAASLAKEVNRYTAYSERIDSFTTRRELAGIGGVLIFVLGDPLEIVGADGEAITVNAGEAFIGGVSDSSSLTRGAGEQSGLEIRVPLFNLSRIAGVPLAEFANGVAKLSDILGQAADDLGNRLCEANSDERRFALLDGFLGQRFAVEDAPERTVLWAAEQLASHDAPRAGEVARHIGWSRKHLTQKFHERLGLTPDIFRRLARFERFSNALKGAPKSHLADLAYGHGFADQAHLTREVQRFGAMTPGELRRRLVPEQGGVRDD